MPPKLVVGALAASGALLYLIYRRTRRKPKLILHFDVNETIMVGDPAGGDTFEDCLNKMICKSAFVRAKAPGADPLTATHCGELLWWDGTPLEQDSTRGSNRVGKAGSPPPPLGSPILEPGAF